VAGAVAIDSCKTAQHLTMKAFGIGPFAARGLTLPLHPGLQDKDIQYVVRTLDKILN
jgi:dTDP-4-amino-4,6-dideoxygalactose transaminase